MVRTLRMAFALTATLTAVFATGCGGSDKAASTSDKSRTTGQSTSTDSSPASSTAKELKIGQPRVVTYEASDSKVKSSVTVTPKMLEKGSIADFANISLEPSQKRSTPYYVKVAVTNVGPGDLSKSDPTNSLLGVDSQGETQTSVTFIGDFARCKAAEAPKSLKKGESFETCLVYLIPQGGGALAGVKWSQGDVTWKS